MQRRLFEEDRPVPDLGSYDVILINTSAGKDSQAMLDVVVGLCDEHAVPRSRLVVVHADLGRVEWPGTAELAEEQAAHYGLRFEKVKRSQGDLLALVKQRGMWPDAARRYCTSALKKGQVLRVMTSLVEELNAPRLLTWRTPLKKAGLRPIRILNCLGMRAEESPARAKKPPFRHDAKASNGKRRVDEWLPLHAWSEHEVWDRIMTSGVPYSQVYDDPKISRLSCTFCVLASRSQLVRSAQLRPDLATEYEALEARIGHRFKKDLSMKEIIEEASRAPGGIQE